MAWDIKKEIIRKCLHLLSLSFLVVYALFNEYFTHKKALLALSLMLIILFELEYVRIELQKKIPIIGWFNDRFRRKRECHYLGGEVFFLMGAIISLAVYDVRIAFTAILMTTFGDMAAAIIGTGFGKTWVFKDRALEGILAEFIVDLGIGFLFLRQFVQGSDWWWQALTLMGQPIWSIIIVMALVATIVEVVVSKIDDNLLVPVISGFAGQTMLIIIGYELI